MEKLQRISDEPLRDCSACGAAELQKLISRVAFRLKGNGWYETDFKQDNKKQLHEDSKTNGSDTKTDAESSSKSNSDQNKDEPKNATSSTGESKTTPTSTAES